MITKTRIAASIWFGTSAIFALGWLIYSLLFDTGMAVFAIIAFVCATLASLPVFIVLLLTISWINNKQIPTIQKLYQLYLVCFICTIPYSLLGGLAFHSNFHDTYFNNYLYASILSCVTLFACSSLSIFIIKNKINNYFSPTKTINFMEQNQFQNADSNFGNTNTNEFKSTNYKTQNTSNKTLVKGLITGALILLMLIPTVFVSNIVSEREKRQQDVVRDVTNGWSTQQTLSGPYLYIPYQVKEGDNVTKKHLYLLPENLNVNGTINPEIRPRSIYKILLYRSELKTNGNFKIQLPKDIEPSSLQLDEAKICYGISDFKGIEEKFKYYFQWLKI